MILDHHGTSRQGLAALKKLAHLHTFIFSDMTSTNQQFVRICMELLPKLRRIGRFHCLLYSWNPCMKGFHNEISAVQRPTELQLKELVLSGQLVIPEVCSLPHLRVMHLTNIHGDLRRLTSLVSLTVMGLYEVEPSVVSELLTLVGPRLSKLTLGSTAPQDIFLPFTWCPNLETFELLNCEALQFPSRIIPLENLSKLCTLKMATAEGCKFPIGFLLQVLNAPQLKNLTLVKLDAQLAELIQLCLMIKAKTILQSLEQYCCQDEHVWQPPGPNNLIRIFNSHIVGYCPSIKIFSNMECEKDNTDTIFDLANELVRIRGLEI